MEGDKEAGCGRSEFSTSASVGPGTETEITAGCWSVADTKGAASGIAPALAQAPRLARARTARDGMMRRDIKRVPLTS